MTRDERDAIRAQHKPEGWPTKVNPEVIVCEACSWWQDDSIEVEWPCDAILMADEADRLEAKLERAERVLKRLLASAKFTTRGGFGTSIDDIEDFIWEERCAPGDFDYLRSLITPEGETE